MFVKELSDKIAFEQEKIQFEVELTKPNHFVKWFLNNKEIESESRFNIRKLNEKKYSLELDNAIKFDSGELRCLIIDQNGNEIKDTKCYLEVIGNF